MRSNELESSLIHWTVLHSGHDTHRSYIGLSGIGDCLQVIYDRYFDGAHANVGDHLLTRLSYDLEAKLIERIGDLGLYGPGEEICLYDGLVQGHTDGVIGGSDLLEIKTLPREDWLPRDGRLSNRIFWQVQAYLHYTKRNYAHVLYLARDTGMVTVAGVRYRPEIGRSVAEKVSRLVQLVMDVQRPGCSCGKCAARETEERIRNGKPA